MEKNSAVAARVIIAILVTSAVWVVGFLVHASIANTMREVHLSSDVYYPVKMIIADIRTAAEAGNAEVATRKLRLFEERWAEFMAGGKPPELFASDIKELTGP